MMRIAMHLSIGFISTFRQQFWILSSRQLIRSVLRKCFECQKANARRGQQMMAPLPANRVNFEPPFSRVGVDYTAKFLIKSTYRGSTPYPCYLVIFTCFVTRAVHLEIVLSDEPEGLLMALKRMISARGHPQHMYSDNDQIFHTELIKRLPKRSTKTMRS